MITASAFQPLHPRWGIDVQSFDRIAIKKADAVAEMAAFDKLGPEARQAMRDTPLDVNARGLVSNLRITSRHVTDFSASSIDGGVARLIAKNVELKFGSPLSCHVLTPKPESNEATVRRQRLPPRYLLRKLGLDSGPPTTPPTGPSRA